MDFVTLFKCFGFVYVNNRGSHSPDSPLSSYMGGVSCGPDAIGLVSRSDLSPLTKNVAIGTPRKL